MLRPNNLISKFEFKKILFTILRNQKYLSTNMNDEEITDPNQKPFEKCKHVKEEVMYKGKWVGLNKITYTDAKGKERTWEAVCRTTTEGSCDGLIDKAESAETCAERELKEETGYTGKCKHISPVTSLEPGMGNTTVQFVTIEIDGDEPCNQNPTPCPEESEFIEVICVPMNELLDRLNEYTKMGYIVDSRVYSYAIAMEQTKKAHELMHKMSTDVQELT